MPRHCDTGVGDVGVPVEGIGYQMTLSSARALWGCALGGPAKGHPALHDRNQCSGTPPLPGVPPYMRRPPAGGCIPPRLTRETAPFPHRVFASSVPQVWRLTNHWCKTGIGYSMVNLRALVASNTVL